VPPALRSRSCATRYTTFRLGTLSAAWCGIAVLLRRGAASAGGTVALRSRTDMLSLRIGRRERLLRPCNDRSWLPHRVRCRLVRVGIGVDVGRTKAQSAVRRPSGDLAEHFSLAGDRARYARLDDSLEHWPACHAQQCRVVLGRIPQSLDRKTIRRSRRQSNAMRQSGALAHVVEVDRRPLDAALGTTWALLRISRFAGHVV
jgi:hypothetical protein